MSDITPDQFGKSLYENKALIFPSTLKQHGSRKPFFRIPWEFREYFQKNNEYLVYIVPWIVYRVQYVEYDKRNRPRLVIQNPVWISNFEKKPIIPDKEYRIIVLPFLS